MDSRTRGQVGPLVSATTSLTPTIAFQGYRRDVVLGPTLGSALGRPPVRDADGDARRTDGADRLERLDVDARVFVARASARCRCWGSAPLLGGQEGSRMGPGEREPPLQTAAGKMDLDATGLAVSVSCCPLWRHFPFRVLAILPKSAESRSASDFRRIEGAIRPYGRRAGSLKWAVKVPPQRENVNRSRQMPALSLAT
jgi:hypothetical protein